MDKNLDFDLYSRQRNSWYLMNLPVHKERDRNRVILSRSIKLSSNKTFAAYRYWGKSCSDCNDHEKGLLKFKRALAINPEAWEIAQETADSLKNLNRLEEALVYAQKALEFGPDGKFVHTRFLQILQMLEKLDDFESYYKQLLNLYPLRGISPNFYYAKAEALVGLNKYAFSLPSYKKAVELAPEHSHYHFQYGMALYYEGLWSDALEIFERVVALNPTNKLAYNNVAFLNYNLGHIKEAIDALEYIVENDLEIYATYSNLILMNYHLHQNKEEIMPYYEKLKRYIESDYSTLKFIYNEDLKLTELRLAENLDEETREWNLRKLSGLKLVISLIG